MRISDWSSDVCSSDLAILHRHVQILAHQHHLARAVPHVVECLERLCPDRKSVVSGKSVSVRVALGGRRIINKTKSQTKTTAHTAHKSEHHTYSSHDQTYIAQAWQVLQ